MMRRSRALLALLPLVAACQLIGGFDDYELVGSGTTDPDGGDRADGPISSKDALADQNTGACKSTTNDNEKYKMKASAMSPGLTVI